MYRKLFILSAVISTIVTGPIYGQYPGNPADAYSPPPPPSYGSGISPEIPVNNQPLVSGSRGYPSPIMVSGGNQKAKLQETTAKSVRKLLQGIDSIRGLPSSPRDDASLRKILEIGLNCTDLLMIGRFPSLPRFQAQSEQVVIRDRSYDSYEYRHFGKFQTRLDGWIKSSALDIQVDLQFSSHGSRWIAMKGVIHRIGPLSGSLLLEGSDVRGRRWNLKVEMKNLMLRDDWFPSSGWLQISGWDPAMKSMTIAMNFPCEIIGDPPKLEWHAGNPGRWKKPRN